MGYEVTMSLRLLLAAVLGALIGMERESLNKTAGLRTHTLVCLGSCLIMITSIEMYTLYGHGSMGDPARLAAQVVSGIGFLGAGTILRSGFGVRGLTTAASLWVVAGIGLAVGAGRYLIAVVTTAIVFLVLVYFTTLETMVRSSQKKLKGIEIIILDKPGQLGKISTTLGEMEINIKKVELSEMQADGYIRIHFIVNIPYSMNKKEIMERLGSIEGVCDVSIN